MSEEPNEPDRAIDIENQEIENKRKKIRRDVKQYKINIKLWMNNDLSNITDVVSCNLYQIIFNIGITPQAELDLIKTWVETRGYKYKQSIDTNKFTITSPNTLDALKKANPEYSSYEIVDISVDYKQIQRYTPIQLFNNDIDDTKYNKLCRDIQHLHDTVGHISYIIQEQNEKLENINVCVNDISNVIASINKEIKAPQSNLDSIIKFCEDFINNVGTTINKLRNKQ